MSISYTGGAVATASVGLEPVGFPLKCYSLALSAGAYSYTGIAVAAGYRSNPSTNPYSITGNHVAANYTAVLETVPYTYTGIEGSFAITMSEEGGDYILTGNNVKFYIGYRVNTTTGSYNYTLSRVDMEQSGYPILYTDYGSYNISFKTYNAYALKAMFGERGQFKFKGNTVFLSFGYTSLVSRGVFTITGRPVDFSITMPAESGFYDFIGQDAFRDIRYNPPNTGHYSYTAYPVTFSITMPVLSGSYSIQIYEAKASKKRAVFTTTGQYVCTGNTAGLQADHFVKVDKGSYALTLGIQSAVRPRGIAPTTGVYAINYNSLATVATRKITADLGAYSYVLYPQSAIAIRYINITSGGYTITGVNPVIQRKLYLRLTTASYAVTGRSAILTRIDFNDLFNGDHMIKISEENRVIAVAA